MRYALRSCAMSILLLLVAVSAGGAAKNTNDFEKGYYNYDKPLRLLLGGQKRDSKPPKILIEKGKRRLTILSGDRAVKSYPVVFGFNPVEDKLREGDGCTPEGIFAIRSKYHHKLWSRFLWIDYPNKGSFKKYEDAKKKGRIEADAAIGGAVGIHGVPSGSDNLIDEGRNWTLGCISLKNRDIEEIYEFVEAGTSVEIKR
ncbi:MAG: L,D-transpeptidase [Pseudomonadota bacterium]